MFQWCRHGVTLIPSVVAAIAVVGIVLWSAGTRFPAQPVVQGVQAFVDDPVMRNIARQDREIGALIDRLARFEQTANGRSRILGLQQRPVGAPPDALHDHLGIRLEPDRDGLVADPLAGLRAHEGAAAGGDDGRAAVEQPGNHADFAIPEICLATGLKDFRD